MSRIFSAIAIAGAVAAGTAAVASSTAELRVTTRDWVLVAPDELGSRADLELMAREIQICTNELKKLIGHRPSNVARFEMRWIRGATRSAGAHSQGVINTYVAGDRLPAASEPGWWQSLASRGVCFGPHEVAHVLTWESWGTAWANEGFATFTDHLYDASWGCCAAPIPRKLRCDAAGYGWALERHAFSDLSPFAYDAGSYNTASCFWAEVHRIGGFPAIRAILVSMRGERPRTTGAIVVRHVNPILGTDLRPLLVRFGFEPAELEAPARRLPPELCTRIGTAGRDLFTGTRGRDVLCGLGGPDVFRTRDGSVDSVRCGSGTDVVTADRRDRVAKDCERVSRR